MWQYHKALETGTLCLRDGRTEIRLGSLAQIAVGQLVPESSGHFKPWPARPLEQRSLDRAARKRVFWRRDVGLVAAAFLGLIALIAAAGVIGAIDRGRLAEEAGEIAGAVGFIFALVVLTFVVLTPLWLREYRDRVTRIEDEDLTLRLDGEGLSLQGSAGNHLVAGAWHEIRLADVEVLEQISRFRTQKLVHALTLADASGRERVFRPKAFLRGRHLAGEILWALADHGRFVYTSADGTVRRSPSPAAANRTAPNGIADAPSAVASPPAWTPPLSRNGLSGLILLAGLFVVVLVAYGLIAVLMPRPLPRPVYDGPDALLVTFSERINGLIDQVQAADGDPIGLDSLCRADFYYDATRWLPVAIIHDEAAVAQATEAREIGYHVLDRLARRAGHDHWDAENEALCGPPPAFYEGNDPAIKAFIATANRMIAAARLDEPFIPQDICRVEILYVNAEVRNMELMVQGGFNSSARPFVSRHQTSTAISHARAALGDIAEGLGYTSLIGWMKAVCVQR